MTDVEVFFKSHINFIAVIALYTIVINFQALLNAGNHYKKN